MTLRQPLLICAVFACNYWAHAQACPTPFKLSGKTTQSWGDVTNNQWKKMLPQGWTDNGFHFYERVRERGPKNGINTPSDLESEIRKKESDKAVAGTRSRRDIILPIMNNDGKKLHVFYDRNKGKCELVTLSY